MDKRNNVFCYFSIEPSQPAEKDEEKTEQEGEPVENGEDLQQLDPELKEK